MIETYGKFMASVNFELIINTRITNVVDQRDRPEELFEIDEMEIPAQCVKKSTVWIHL